MTRVVVIFFRNGQKQLKKNALHLKSRSLVDAEWATTFTRYLEAYFKSVRPHNALQNFCRSESSMFQDKQIRSSEVIQLMTPKPTIVLCVAFRRQSQQTSGYCCWESLSFYFYGIWHRTKWPVFFQQLNGKRMSIVSGEYQNGFVYYSWTENNHNSNHRRSMVQSKVFVN